MTEFKRRPQLDRMQEEVRLWGNVYSSGRTPIATSCRRQEGLPVYQNEDPIGRVKFDKRFT